MGCGVKGVALSNSNPDQVKNFSPNELGRKNVWKKDNHQIDTTKSGRRKYQIYCNKRHLLFLTRGELYRTIIKGHVITTLRINELTLFGFEKKTDIGGRK